MGHPTATCQNSNLLYSVHSARVDATERVHATIPHSPKRLLFFYFPHFLTNPFETILLVVFVVLVVEVSFAKDDRSILSLRIAFASSFFLSLRPFLFFLFFPFPSL